MLTFSSKTSDFRLPPATDMRKGFAGLSAIIREEFQADPTDGSLFLFINKRRDRMKLLHFADGGFWLYYRLLEAGTFETLKATRRRIVPAAARCDRAVDVALGCFAGSSGQATKTVCRVMHNMLLTHEKVFKLFQKSRPIGLARLSDNPYRCGHARPNHTFETSSC